MAYLVLISGVGDTSCEVNRSLGEEYDSEEVFDLASDCLVLTSSDGSYFLATKWGIDLYTGSTYTPVNTAVINETAYADLPSSGSFLSVFPCRTLEGC